MRIIAIILVIFIFKAGTALPITEAQLVTFQNGVELLDDDDCVPKPNCCDDQDDKGCCDTGLCCCISVGGLTMTIQNEDKEEFDLDTPLYPNIFDYQFSYFLNFNNAVFQPPQLV